MNVIQQLKLLLALKKAQKEIRMQGWKSIFSSKTVYGILIAAVPLISSVTGLNITEGLVGDGIQLVGLVVAFVGRVMATKQLAIAPNS